MDDEFMSKVFDGHKEETELVLKIILKKNDLNVISVKTQAELKNLQGRSIKLDILATDKSNRVYNIEVQKSASGASPLRARYHSSLIDSNSVGKGCSWNDLPETYVIFITETDVLQKNLPIYHVERRIKETEEPFNDKAHIIYVNGQNEDETELGLLMHDFRAENPDEMHYKLLADRVRVYKET
ncbi:MAG: PD-(D/E)XK nuclease family transposase, partial [Firmicutes bacterium]|nr:PD-(D/E)XK nuclease family transposase [Bacillota bacterium]